MLAGNDLAQGPDQREGRRVHSKDRGPHGKPRSACGFAATAHKNHARLSNPSCSPTSTSPTATRCACTSRPAATPALRKMLAEMTPADVVGAGQGQQPARPRRGRLSDRPEVDVPAEGPSRPDLHVHQRRRERAGHVQQPHPDGGGPAPGARRDHPSRCYAIAVARRPTSTCATSTPLATACCERRSTSATPPGYLGKNILGSGFSLDIYLHRGAGGVHLRRRDGADRKPGRQAGLAADQAAVSRPSKGLFRKPTVVNNIETLCLRDAHRRPRRRLVQIDRRAARPEQPARRRQLRPEAVLPQRAREQAGLLRSAAGHHRAAS